MRTLGLDTSNYTTSAALFDGEEGYNAGKLLEVPEGQLGLRQSEALFQHIKALPDRMQELRKTGPLKDVAAVAASTRPREVEGSYMPCFLAGICQARTLAAALRVPLAEVSHQQGHIAASLWSAGRMELMDEPHLAWHLSGGTTELLLVEPEGKNVKCSCIGGTSDISAGQLIDRTGQLLGLQFPAGKGLDALSREAMGKDLFKVKCMDFAFSLSGVENKVRQYYEKNRNPAETAGYALRCVVHAVKTATCHAQKAYPGLQVVFSGGVASNEMLRQQMLDCIFCPPEFATDNAMGVAVLARRIMEG